MQEFVLYFGWRLVKARRLRHKERAIETAKADAEPRGNALSVACEKAARTLNYHQQDAIMPVLTIFLNGVLQRTPTEEITSAMLAAD